LLNYLPCENKTDEKSKQSHCLQTKGIECVILPLELLYDGCSYGLFSRPAVEEGGDKEVFQFGRVNQSDEVEEGDDDGDKERKVNHFHYGQETPALERERECEGGRGRERER
jgi:hypothetical protein